MSTTKLSEAPKRPTGTTGPSAAREAIEVIDLGSGRTTSRDPDSLTLDVPIDLDPASATVSVDADGLAHYTTAGGEAKVTTARLTRLGARASGQECLVGDEEIQAGGAFAVRRYRLCQVGPTAIR